MSQSRFDNKPPVPKARTFGAIQDNQNRGNPPQYSPTYVPPIPQPIMNGYLDKQSGDAEKKNLSWLRKYVEVSEGTLRYFNSREERDESGIVVPLADTFVSIQNKRNIRLENRNGVRIFRANCELRAQTWGFVLAQYCIVAPMGEGFCKKLSGGKDNVWEERYVRLAADGILSWHKNDEGEARGAIQVRGEGKLELLLCYIFCNFNLITPPSKYKITSFERERGRKKTLFCSFAPVCSEDRFNC
ncbi:uncharacterized protein LOC143464577 isoform X2 [Clavelina lepadiformis]|uniref:uncharacterized protein LOC143464577 isoform X2 n=1 Tax=Clavelina lepadiformis TaxID=159417 RepID=UPI0040432A20